MKQEDFELEILHETDLINQSTNWEPISGEPAASQLQALLLAIQKACSTFLNDQDTKAEVDKFTGRK